MEIPILSYEQSLTDSQEYDIETKIESLDRNSTLDDSITQCYSPCVLPLNLIGLYSSLANANKSEKFYKEETLIDQSNMCVEHMKCYAYSCKTCEENICWDCMSNPAKHRGHRFEKYNQKKEELRLLLEQISAKLKFKRQNTQRILVNMKKKHSNEEEVRVQKEEKLEKHIKRLQTSRQLCPQIQRLQEQVNRNRNQIKEQNSFYQSCLIQLTQNSKINIISQTGHKIESQLTQHIKNVNQIQHKFSKMQSIPIITPQPIEIFFHIHNFTQLKQQKAQVILDSFHAFHNIWRLKTYPAGFTPQNPNQNQNQKPYLSVYIERLSGILPTTKFTIQIQIKSKINPNLVINKQFQPEFTHNQSWGYDKYTRLSNIYDHGFLGNDDTLTIKLQISPINYLQAIQTVKLVTQQKQGLMKINKERIRTLRERLLSKNENVQKQYLKQDSKSVTVDEYSLEDPQCQNQENKKSPQEWYPFNHISQPQCQRLLCVDQLSQPQTQSFSTTLKQQIKSKLSNEICDLGIKKICKVKYGQTFIDEYSPRRLIRLVSHKNAELAQSCKKRVHSRSNTHD